MFKLPEKCKFFLWSMMQRGLNTVDKIQIRRPNQCLSPNWCPLCNKRSETMDHLFLHNEYTIELRQKLTSNGNIITSLADRILSNISTTTLLLYLNLVTTIFYGLTSWPLFLARIWLERNWHIFADEKKNNNNLCRKTSYN